MTWRTVESLLSCTYNWLVIGDFAAIVRAVVCRKELRTEVARFKYQAAKSQRRNFLVETLRDAPGGIFGCTVEPDSTSATAIKERPGYP